MILLRKAAVAVLLAIAMGWGGAAADLRAASTAALPAIGPDETLPEKATPLLWRMKGTGAEIAILGSFHLLPPRMKWRTPEIEAAFKAAEVVVFEAPDEAKDGRAADDLMQELGRLPEGMTLRDLVGQQSAGTLADAAWRVNYPVQLIDRFEPWLASVMLELMLYVKKGLSPWYGVDHVLTDMAREAGKKLSYLETMEEQLGFLADLPRPIGLKMVASTVDGIMTEPHLVDDLLRAWAMGDAVALERITRESMNDVPELTAVLLTARNKRWVPQIEAMARSGRPHLVVVGAAHLTGRDSVIALLRARGHRIEGP